MTNQKLKIQKFSKVIYTLLKVAFVATIVAIVLLALAWTWNLLQLPVLFQFGDIRIIMPFVNTANAEAGILGMDFWLHNLLEAIVTLVALSFAKRIFNLLCIDGNPFCEGVVNSFKKLAIVLLVVGFFSGAAGFIGAAIVWLLYLIFDYGYALQRESDTTL